MEISDIRRENLRRLMSDRFGGKQAKIADALDKSPNYISRCLSVTMAPEHRKKIGEDFAREIETRLQLSRYYMDHDHEAEQTAADPSEDRVLIELRSTPGHRLTDRPGFIEIPQLDVHGSMGSGAIRPEIVDVIQRMTVSMDFLRQSVTFSRPDNLALITGYGDSMEGTFNDGDLLLVDRGVNDVKIDAVYVLSLNDELYIKRLQRRGDGTFTMISDNRKYEPIPISEKDLTRFQVLGRVLLAWNARKL